MSHNSIPVKITKSFIGNSEIQSVDGEELHAFLGIATHWTRWLQRRIVQYGFTQGIDFTVANFGKPDGSITYTLSIGMAKELCMVEKTPKGKQARLYFLACERQALTERGSFKIPAKDAMEAAEVAVRMLNLPPSGVIRYTQAVANQYGIALPSPDYAIDNGGAIIAGEGSSRVTKSATALLKEAGAGMSAIRFNKLAIAAGILEEKTRPSSKGGDKKFIAITDRGLKYGKNLISPSNPRETQPHWFEDSFSKLMGVLNGD